VDGITICPLTAPCGFDKSAAHRSHALRSRAIGKRSRIARRRVISGPRICACLSMRARVVQSVIGVTT
jgi:hypothetical protein